MKDRLRKILTPGAFTISIVVIIGLVALYRFAPAFVEILELKALDVRFKVRGPIEPGPEVVIAVIDEKSVDELGRWPWPRSEIARLIAALSQDGARSIAFDIVFGEPDANTNLALIDKLNREIESLGLENNKLIDMLTRERLLADNDLILAQAMNKVKTPVILGYFFHTSQEESLSHLSDEQVRSKIAGVSNGRYTNRLPPLPEGVQYRTDFIPRYFVPETNIRCWPRPPTVRVTSTWFRTSTARSAGCPPSSSAATGQAKPITCRCPSRPCGTIWARPRPTRCSTGKARWAWNT